MVMVIIFCLSVETSVICWNIIRTFSLVKLCGALHYHISEAHCSHIMFVKHYNAKVEMVERALRLFDYGLNRIWNCWDSLPTQADIIVVLTAYAKPLINVDVHISRYSGHYKGKLCVMWIVQWVQALRWCTAESGAVRTEL